MTYSLYLYTYKKIPFKIKRNHILKIKNLIANAIFYIYSFIISFLIRCFIRSQQCEYGAIWGYIPVCISSNSSSRPSPSENTLSGSSAPTTNLSPSLRKKNPLLNPLESSRVLLKLPSELLGLHWNMVQIRENIKIITKISTKLFFIHFKPMTLADTDVFDSLNVKCHFASSREQAKQYETACMSQRNPC